MVDRRSPAAPLPVHLDVELKGVVLPTWVAVTLSVIAALSAGVVLLAVLIFREAAESLSRAQAGQMREIRVLDLHVQDVENALIRNGLARREDFAQRTPTNIPPEGEQPK